MSAALSLDTVSAGYGPITILDGLSLTLGPTETLLILGANGSGKSTVLKTIMGLTRQSAGTVRVGGTDATALAAHQRAALGLGYVPQTGNVFPSLTVRENLRMGGWLGSDINARLPDLLALFPRLKDRLAAKASVLSGGERRMLSIALTMIAAPKILLLDEPSSDLAPAMVAEVFAAIEKIHEAFQIPVLVVEQNVSAGLGIADRVIVMGGGRVIADMPAADVRTADLHTLFLEGTFRSNSASHRTT